MAKTSKRAIESDMRLSAILAKRVTGMSLRQIGLEESPPISLQRVAQLISRAVTEMVAEPLEHMRRLELLRLDKLFGAVWTGAIAGDIACVDRCLAIMARRAKLLGLDLQQPGYYSRDGEEIDPSTIKVEIVGNPEIAKMEWLESERDRLLALVNETPTTATLN